METKDERMENERMEENKMQLSDHGEKLNPRTTPASSGLTARLSHGRLLSPKVKAAALLEREDRVRSMDNSPQVRRHLHSRIL